MIKSYLIGYELIDVYPFGDGEHYTVYELKIKRVYFWGLWDKIVASKYEIPFYGNIKTYTDHWDKLIETGKNLK